MAENLGVNYSENLGVNPFPVRKRPFFAGNLSPSPAADSPAPMNVDYSTSILELLSPAERAELERQSQMDWDEAQSRFANRMSELRKRKQSLPEGITYDVGNKSTPQSIDAEELAPLRMKLASVFPSIAQQERLIETQKQREVEAQLHASTDKERELNQSIKRANLQRQQQNDFEKNALTSQLRSSITQPGQTIRPIPGGFEVVPSRTELNPFDKIKREAYAKLLRDAYAAGDEDAIQKNEAALAELDSSSSNEYIPTMNTGTRNSFLPPKVSGGVGGAAANPLKVGRFLVTPQ